ncbi:MAG: A/G-specific adenine glycosylase [Verrucomicrobiota bacterium]|nr:A/G-specific adenine glycosylase [Verrucomicrobiota bacterium]
MTLVNGEITSLQNSLLKWYKKEQRPLPWRVSPSLYKTVVSELMAQQTKISTMLPYFERWMKRFPSFESLAKAPSEDVLKQWEGLGYYSRARNLHALAKEIILMDLPPQTAEKWQLLPGIGPYTAAAISSIAQGIPEAVVDGNVVRLVARLTNDHRTFKNNSNAVKTIAPLAKKLLNHASPGEHNQAMMELGATLCTKTKPKCSQCPVKTLCLASAQGDPHVLPKINRAATSSVTIDRAWIKNKNRLLLYLNSADAHQLAGQYELPSLESLGAKTPNETPFAIRTRAITNRRIKERIHSGESLSNQKLLFQSEHQWICLERINSITLSGPHRRWVQEFLEKPWVLNDRKLAIKM